MRRRRNGQSGSVATEYMLVISVVVIGTSAAGYTFVPGFKSGTDALATDVSSILSTHDIGGIGMAGQGNAGVAPPVPVAAPAACPNPPCNAQTTGVGGNPNGSLAAAPGVSAEVVSAAADPALAGTEVQAAAQQAIVDNATADCSQVFMAPITGQTVAEVTTNTVTQGLTKPDTVPLFHIPWFGSFGHVPVNYRGFMSLAQMQQYLNQNGIAATTTDHGTVQNIRDALARGDRVGVIVDVNERGQPATGCNGACGHTVNVLGFETQNGVDYVRISDRTGEHLVAQNAFEAGWDAQHDGMIAVTPRHHGGGDGWAQNP